MAIAQSNMTTLLTAAQGSMVRASATVTLANAVPANNDTIVVNGVTYTFKTSASAATDVAIASGDINTTVANLTAALAASTNIAVSIANYSASSAIMTITYRVPGTVGNAYTLAATFGTTANISIAGAATVTGDGTATTLHNGANTSATKYAPDSVTNGTIAAARSDSFFEQNLVLLMAGLEFTLANSADPSLSDANYALARQQRKAVKELLAKLSQFVEVAPNATSDDRATMAATVVSSGVSAYNAKTRPDAI